MVEVFKTDSANAPKVRKEWEKEGWRSAHYWSRKGAINPRKAREEAKKGRLRARQLEYTDSANAAIWYYHEVDISQAMGFLY